MAVGTVELSDGLAGIFCAATNNAVDSTFGAYVMQAVGDQLIIGLCNQPILSDGALIARVSADGVVTPDHVLDSQGVADMQVVDDTLYIPDVDPTESWSFGNLNIRSADCSWIKRRTIPGQVHGYGMFVADDGTIAVCGQSQDTPPGTVKVSIDNGLTWETTGIPGGNIVWDVIEFGNVWYATVYDAPNNYSGYLYRSDDLITWIAVDGISLADILYPRMIVWDGKLIVSNGLTVLYAINGDGSFSVHNLQFSISRWFNVAAVIGAYLYILDTSGYVWRSNDLTNWTRWTRVENAISIAALPDGNLAIADCGLSARIWKCAVN